MEDVLRKELGSTVCELYGRGGGGCICTGQSYKVDQGIIYVKENRESKAKAMFEGEYASLQAVLQTGAIKAPKPIKVLERPKGAILLMEHVDISGLSSRNAALLGEQVANMHLHNEKMLQKADERAGSIHKTESEDSPVAQFGFHIPTCCGSIAQDNSWKEEWVSFYCQNKLQQQLSLVEKEYGDREAAELWPKLQRAIPKMFEGLDVKPALVHGDLWSGNVGECPSGPLIFDPGCFYGHHEYDLGISKMFGGLGSNFFKAYHKVIPKNEGFDERNKLYQLFHYLNHWNHFGGGYRGTSISIMRELAR